MIAIFLILASVEYQLQKDFIANVASVSTQFILNEKRIIKLVEMLVSIRSFANTANSLEFEGYSDPSLKRIDRFEYLSALIQTELADMFDIENQLSHHLSSAS